MRTYKPVRPKFPRGRMLRGAAMRADGLSFRQIAAELGVSKDTVMRDLRKWDAEQSKVSHLPVSKTPPGGRNETAARDGSATVLPLRRTS